MLSTIPAVVAAVVTVAGLAYTPVLAATCQQNDFSAFSGAVACTTVASANGGNVTASAMNAGGGAFGLTGWTLLEKFDTPNGAVLSGDAFSLTAQPGNAGGSWSLADGLSFAPGASYAFALKGGPGAIVYLLDGLTTSGMWLNSDLPLVGDGGNGKGKGNGGGNLPGLSNITLFGTAPLAVVTQPLPLPEPGDVAAIPLPAAGWLMLAGLGALAALRRRAGRA